MSQHSLTLRLLADTFAIVRLPADAALPTWIVDREFVSITRTTDELSIVCADEGVPPDTIGERPWRCLQVIGPLDFALTGVLVAIAQPLAQAHVSIFAVSTYDTDYVLVKAATLDQAIAALQDDGHTIML